MRHRRPARLIVAALAALASIGTVATTAAADPFPPTLAYYPLGFYSVPYDDTLLWAHRIGQDEFDVTVATYEQWQAEGFPTPTPVGAVYERSPWQDVIIAKPQLPDRAARLARPVALEYEQWARAGFPTPRVSYNPPGMRYFTHSTTSIVYATNVYADGQPPHALTYPEWLASGSPTPSRQGASADVQVYRWSTSPEVFLWSYGTLEKLTFGRWSEIGQPVPTVDPAGFYKLAWSPEIAFVDGEDSEVLTYDVWVDEGFPTPLSLPTLPGDQYCHDAGAGVVRYDGHTVVGDLDPATAEARLGVPVAQMQACVAG